MRTAELTYDGTTYRLAEAAVDDLVARGVILPDPLNAGRYDLSAEHLIDEVVPLATFESYASGEDAREGSRDDAAARLRELSLQYHRDGQGI
ncbi:MAG TPA: hypothetical protein VEY67_12765 [Candidatus Dormibacteraeota bacterium]|nr:hypothetical protein [Candidatus Dormibacteraeota bacterium]